VLNDDGHTVSTRDKILTVKVKSGWKQGTRITFPKEGDQGPSNIPADVVFVVQYLEHPRFVREGNDLVHTADITLVESLCGCIVELLTLDGRKLSIPVNDVITPGFAKTVPNEGMPLTKQAGQRGNLVLRFNIEFPRNLSEERKALIRQALAK
jgi:DnaJ family protein B protein 13